MFNLIYFIYLFYIIFNSISVGYSKNLNNNNHYSNLIAKANLYYLKPNRQSEDILITNLKNPFKSKSDDIKIIIHGWNAYRYHIATVPLSNAYIAKGHDAVFVADWGEASRILYFDSRYFVEPIGLRFAKILKTFMRKNNISPDKIHILGHSLGAHIAGVIGKYFNGTIGRITGLDPAGPLFENFVTDGLLPTHAKFVDCIHTDSPILGQSLQRGHVDFYPNYGKFGQPGCEFLDIITGTACSHYRAPLFYAETIQLPKNFPSFSCPLKSVVNYECYPRKAKRITMMGEDVAKSARGVYYLPTHKFSPFGYGMSSIMHMKFKNGNYSELLLTTNKSTSNKRNELTHGSKKSTTEKEIPSTTPFSLVATSCNDNDFRNSSKIEDNSSFSSTEKRNFSKCPDKNNTNSSVKV